jgi:hypothetical protein
MTEMNTIAMIGTMTNESTIPIMTLDTPVKVIEVISPHEANVVSGASTNRDILSPRPPCRPEWKKFLRA